MDSFLGTIVFIIPGLLLYFWLQSFGIKSVVKHTTAEFTAIVAILWLPVSLITLLLYNLVIKFGKLASDLIPIHFIPDLTPIHSITDLKAASDSFIFLGFFILLSIIVSFLFGVVWSKWLHKRFMNRINDIRKRRGSAPFSKSPSVWDEVFGKDIAQVVELGKIDKQDSTSCFIGRIANVSRHLEPERNIHLADVAYYTELVEKYKIPVKNIFYDTKSGSYIKVFDSEKVSEAINASEAQDKEKDS